MRQRGAKTAFKKALTFGSAWQLDSHINPNNSGIRKVYKVQAKAVAFEYVRDSITDRALIWLPFDDKTADYANPAPGVFQVYSGDTLILTYTQQP